MIRKRKEFFSPCAVIVLYGIHDADKCLLFQVLKIFPVWRIPILQAREPVYDFPDQAEVVSPEPFQKFLPVPLSGLYLFYD